MQERDRCHNENCTSGRPGAWLRQVVEKNGTVGMYLFCLDCADAIDIINAKSKCDTVKIPQRVKEGAMESDTPFVDSVAFDVRDGRCNVLESGVVAGHYARGLERERDALKQGFDKQGRTAAEACCERFKSEQALRIQTLERELAAVTAERDALANANEWQTIGSAPKDGTLILVYNGKSIWVDYFSDTDMSDAQSQRRSPTHWRPLPQPPKE